MAKNNRIRLKRSVVIAIAITAVVLAVIVLLLVMKPWADSDAAESPVGVLTEPEARASSADLYCLEFTRYSGAFVEDGTNEQVDGVAAIRVENRSDEFLERATVTYDAGGQTATFVVTGLPPGEQAWVLEKDRMVLEEGTQFEFSDCTSAFRQDAVMTTEDIEVMTEGNTITVTNRSGETLKNVCVYYKNTYTDGVYLGGITYMIGFDELSPDETAQKDSAHFSDNSRIVRYSYQTE